MILGRTTASACVVTSPRTDEADLMMFQDMVDATVFSPSQPRFHTDVILRVVLGENNPDLVNRTTANQTLLLY
jgi:hypothetical protein